MLRVTQVNYCESFLLLIRLGSVFGDASITFNPMKKEDVHITAVFIGDGLHRLKYQPLADFHSQLSQVFNAIDLIVNLSC